jgi:hypothetical protein
MLNLLQNQPTPLPGQEWQIETISLISVPLSPDAHNILSPTVNPGESPAVETKDKVLVLQLDFLNQVVKVKVTEGRYKGEIGYIYEYYLRPRIRDHVSDLLSTILRSTLGENFSL